MTNVTHKMKCKNIGCMCVTTGTFSDPKDYQGHRACTESLSRTSQAVIGVVRYAELECSWDNVPLIDKEGTSAGVACAWDPAQPSRGTCRPQEHQFDDRNISKQRLRQEHQSGWNIAKSGC